MWRRRCDLNARIKILQTFVLPLHYCAIKFWQPVLVTIQRQRCQRPLYFHYTNRPYKTRRIYLCPKIGIEPAIAFLLGKCLNHLNYSGSRIAVRAYIIHNLRLTTPYPFLHLRGSFISGNVFIGYICLF